jgi:hypothetical protein
MQSLSLPSVLVSALAFLTSCVIVPTETRSSLPPPSAGVLVVDTPTEWTGPFLAKSYEIGARAVASVGEPVISVREYSVSRKPAVRPSNDFALVEVGGLRRHLPVRAHQLLSVTGTATIDGVAYRIVDVGERILIDSEGRAAKSLGSFDRVREVELEPSATTFADEPKEETWPGALNFELLYSGADATTIRLLYREYTAEGLARPAFSQELVYDRAQAEVAFRAIRIRVEEITPNGLAYAVLADGL